MNVFCVTEVDVVLSCVVCLWSRWLCRLCWWLGSCYLAHIGLFFDICIQHPNNDHMHKINYSSATGQCVNCTEVAKHIWKLKDNKENYETSSASAYNISKRCNLCLTEKLHITKTDKASNLTKRTGLLPNAATRTNTS